MPWVDIASSFVSLLNRNFVRLAVYTVAVDVNYVVISICSSNPMRRRTKLRVPYNEIYLSLEAYHVMLVQVLKAHLTEIVKLLHRFTIAIHAETLH